MTEGIRAIHALAQMGYRAWADGKDIRMLFEGEGAPNPAAVAPLMALVQQHKENVLFFLKCHCPKCGGSFFGTFNGVEQCLGCYYSDLENTPPRSPTHDRQ